MRLLGLLDTAVRLVVATLMLGAAAIHAVLFIPLPHGDGHAAISGLAGAVAITFDDDGIPRIQAGSADDAAAALGYVHARDRMFQMDLTRRAASGRLSELAGPATLKLDRTMRVLGLLRSAQAEWDGLPADARSLLEAYARGVNARIAERGRFVAAEFAVLGRPSPWTPVDSLLWGKTMALFLSGNWREELARAGLAGKLTPQQIDELWPSQPGTPPPSAALDVRFAALATRLNAAIPRFPDPFTLPESASNEWAVDGAHSASGAPLLAGDPHLGFGQPGFWYLARIETPGGVLAGATAPGVPFLVIGHNGRIAWTFTTTGVDTEDLFTETMLPDGRYQTPDGPRAFETREERIVVRGQPDVVMTVRRSRHGPVVSDLDDAGGPVYAASMAAEQPGDGAAAGLMALNQAQDVEAAGRAAAGIASPIQNLLAADHDRIAQFTTGRIPIRRSGDGSVPAPGDGSHDWTGFASGASLPHVVSPAGGRIVNGNERVAPPGFPVFLGRDWFGDWRARRIRTLLGDSKQLTTADFAAMQSDDVSSFAQQLLPQFRAVPRTDDLPGRAAALLEGWDGAMDRDAPQPLVFNAWVQAFYALVRQRANVPPGAFSPWEEFTAFVLSPAGAHWCGDGGCGPLLAESLRTSTAALAARFGPDPAAWRWGTVHEAVFAHPILGSIPLLGPLATARIAQSGDDTTVLRGGNRPGALSSVHGAGYRGVYDLADLDSSLFVAVPGQSGHLISRHATDFLQRWRDGATVQLGPHATHVESTLRLDPP